MAAKKMDKGLKELKPMAKKNGAETLKPAPKAKTAVPRKDPVKDLIQNVTNRYRVTAREARDIVTAAGTAFQADQGAAIKAHGGQGVASGPAGKNFVKQVKETAVAAATGKKGTTSDKVPVSGSLSNQNVYPYEKGKKRK